MDLIKAPCTVTVNVISLQCHMVTLTAKRLQKAGPNRMVALPTFLYHNLLPRSLDLAHR
ncbi:hypothetical protein RvY_03322 [Ramazzottius varieornatus]|uniref:Uncharacterized protein n=1 Tax=Ramazzottius varieornatus TaxID=947166 RepID=A0A1D1UNG6_RAMVA|nr:hypothetical protein RvY_03322 [Ramazzottius varieornatus]